MRVARGFDGTERYPKKIIEKKYFARKVTFARKVIFAQEYKNVKKLKIKVLKI